MVDRFANGDPSNDHAYRRGLGPDGTPLHGTSPARYLGGDLVGLTEKVNENYFTDLGVNAIWISSPVEQIHGWVGGTEGAYPAYAYHGYWPLDFTQIDSSLGTTSDFRRFVDACHNKGIRVVMDVVINHAGYNSLQDMSDLHFGALRNDDWRSWKPAPNETWHAYHDRFIDYGDSAAWARWWGPHWIRANISGYDRCGEDDRTTCTSSLPDFKTESERRVSTPEFLLRKWGRRPADDTLSTDLQPADTPAAQLIRWVTQWVRTYGIDGFRLDTARNLDVPTIRALKLAADAALADWKQTNSLAKLDDLPFWMTGEVFGHGVERTEYFDAGLNSVINFAFQSDLEKRVRIDSLYAEYARRINSARGFNVLSYISSHDTKLFDRDHLFDAGTYLMLLPGAVQIFYGDETARPGGPEGALGTDGTRSAMNWDMIDEGMLIHWQKLGQFRRRHPAIAMGEHTLLSEEPYVFSRFLRAGDYTDGVVVVLGAEGKTRVNVSTVFADNTVLRDAYSGKTTFVSYGIVYVQSDGRAPILLEEVR